MQFNNILAKQKSFFLSGATLDPLFRIDQLNRMLLLLDNHEHEFYFAIKNDFGKSSFDTYISELGFIGVWNYPFLLTLSPLISALAAGNTVIVKPSELAPESARLMAKLLGNYFSEELIFAIEGDQKVSSALLDLKFDKIFFTGSPHVGRIVYQAAAKHLTPVTLELGGKSPAIVLPSADLNKAVKRIVWGKFFNGGQTCIAPDYILLHHDIKSQFKSLLIKEIRKNAYLPDSDHFTRIINASHFDRISKLIDPSKVIFGGVFNKSDLYIQPTVMDGVEWNDAIMQEEIFGPVLPLLTFYDFAAIIQALKLHDKPLAAYLFSNNKQEKDFFLKQFSFGGGCINDVLVHASSSYLPFGGVGHSGLGSYHGKNGFFTFSHKKSVIFRKNWGEPNWKFPPYSLKKLKLLKWILNR